MGSKYFLNITHKRRRGKLLISFILLDVKVTNIIQRYYQQLVKRLNRKREIKLIRHIYILNLIQGNILNFQQPLF